jgi:hypothetical protein
MAKGPSVAALCPGEVFESILAGDAAELSRDQLQQLPDVERQQVLCTLCVVCGEVATNCPERGGQIAKVLGTECEHFHDGQRTCKPAE